MAGLALAPTLRPVETLAGLRTFSAGIKTAQRVAELRTLDQAGVNHSGRTRNS